MASVTITTTSQDDARLAPAYGALLGLGRNATAAEIKGWLIQAMKTTVQNYEIQQASQSAAQTASTNPTVSPT